MRHCRTIFGWKYGLFIFLLMNVSCVQASILPTGFNVSYGWGSPNSLHGYRAAVQWDWQPIWFEQSPVNLVGYWDLSFAQWNTNGNWRGQYQSIDIVALAPVFRLQMRDVWFATIKPYLEVSVGLAALSSNHLGRRELGGNCSFQDLLGFGFGFGQRQQFSLSYHYLHYSNAGINSPNHGIDVQSLITFAYKFS